MVGVVIEMLLMIRLWGYLGFFFFFLFAQGDLRTSVDYQKWVEHLKLEEVESEVVVVLNRD